MTLPPPPPAHKKLLAIFDLDGTLALSDTTNIESYRRAFAEHNLPFDEALYTDGNVGRHWSQSLPLLVPGGTPEQFQSIRRAKAKHFAQLAHHARRNEPVVKLFYACGKTHHRAVVTGAHRPNATAILTHLGLLESVELLICGDDVPSPKPNPAGFLKAMLHFECGPAETTIYEDSVYGLEAARATGAKVIDVATLKE